MNLEIIYMEALKSNRVKSVTPNPKQQFKYHPREQRLKKANTHIGYVPSNIPLLEHPQLPKIDLHAVIDGNPLLAALLLGASLGLSPKPAAPNHPELLPINPYVALLLSQYGRYVPLHGGARGIYGYAAANNFHNNKPFGAYKVYEDAKRR
ncbi:uncharacterized protein LOC111691942 [Anoplophora glabripennis]|uniref:uncharacterized protein LOC111691942 n=1 Tax=Anoplophora glabripennis TaxID=217634 RepID=UPI000C75706F|nr:uncharacterized protein LOC111691942 [Anoplophora glabripennis]